MSSDRESNDRLLLIINAMMNLNDVTNYLIMGDFFLPKIKWNDICVQGDTKTHTPKEVGKYPIATNTYLELCMFNLKKWAFLFKNIENYEMASEEIIIHYLCRVLFHCRERYRSALPLKS